MRGMKLQIVHLVRTVANKMINSNSMPNYVVAGNKRLKLLEDDIKYSGLTDWKTYPILFY